MDVTVTVVGEETTSVRVADGDTYADLVRAAGYNPNAVSVLVDGRPVPEDRPVTAGAVEILRLIKGG